MAAAVERAGARPATATSPSPADSNPVGWSYGALGLPLAFVALPLYVQLPHHYASAYGVPLAVLGALLLAVRLLDALVDPWIGRWCDRWLDHSPQRARWCAVLAAVAAAVGFAALFRPPTQDTVALLAWCGGALVVTYLGYSVLAVLHQAWGARLGGDDVQRARVVAWREGLSLAGVLVASVLPSLAGFGAMTAAFGLALVFGLWGLSRVPAPALAPQAAAGDLRLPWRQAAFRRLLAVYLVNGLASAVPATLLLFFVRDRLQAPAWEPVFLGLYVACGAASLPLWVRAAGVLGLARSWGLGMLLAVAAFVWAATLGAGDTLAFALVCVASGAALGADLALPAALLAGAVQQAGHAGRHEGAYFGWWNFASKLNLALAAGLALPLLQGLGYRSGQPDVQGLQALSITYALLPCALKLLAALLLWRLLLRGTP